MVYNKIRLFVFTTCKHARVFTIYIAAAVDVLFICAADDIISPPLLISQAGRYRCLGYQRDSVFSNKKCLRYLYKDQGMINNLSTLCTVKYLCR